MDEVKKTMSGVITVNVYMVMQECVERGIAYGYHRAHKHSDSPSEDKIREEIQNAVMSEICEYFNFGE